MWNQALIRYSLLGYAVSSCIWFSGTRHFLFLALLGALIKIIRDKNIPRFTEPRLLKAVVIFFGVLILSTAFSPDLLLSLKKAGAHVECMLPMFLIILFIRDTRTLSLFLLAMLFSLFIADGMAIWQGIHGDERAAAFASHYMIFAGYLVQVFGVLLALLASSETKFSQYRGLIKILLGLTLAALLFNGTRGVWIAVTIIGIVFSFQRTASKKKWLIGCLFAVLCLSMMLVALPHFYDRVMTLTDKSFESNSERLLLWHSAWQMFVDHPLLGIGVGNFPVAYATHYISPLAVERGLGHAHNTYLHILAEMGITGLLSFLYLYYVLLASSYQNYKAHHSTYSLVLILATAGLLLQGMTEYNFGNPPVIRMYWFLAGIGFSAAAYQSPDRGSDENEA